MTYYEVSYESRCGLRVHMLHHSEGDARINMSLLEKQGYAPQIRQGIYMFDPDLRCAPDGAFREEIAEE